MQTIRNVVCVTLLMISLLLGTKATSHCTYKENLIVKPLLDGKALFHFQFETSQNVPKGEIKHFSIFPKSLGQVLQKFDVQELQLSFTQGRWLYDKWGIPLSPAPVGAELMTWFSGDGNIEQRWKGLVHALSGLFCASLNFLDTTTEFSYAAGVVSESQSDNFRYGTLSQETVCTENLTPFKQLLPSRAKAGLASMLNPIKLYDSEFHSMSVHFKRSGDSYELAQLVSVVFDLDAQQSEGDRLFRDWSLSSVFGLKGQIKQFPLADESFITLDVSADLIQYFGKHTKEADILSITPAGLATKLENMRLAIAGFGDHQLYQIDLKQFNSSIREVGFQWASKRVPVPAGYKPLSTISAQRNHAGYGQFEGQFIVDIQNNDPESSATITYYDAVPWYFKLYFHTLSMKLNGETIQPQHACSFLRITPAKDRQNPGVLEFTITLPANANFTFSIEFDKAFLKYTEHSPDAHRGFDLSCSVISYSLIQSTQTIAHSNNNTIQSMFQWQPVHVTDRNQPVLMNTTRLYTDSLLIGLPTPDFSMPYNVITLSSTIIALFFGSLFNVLIKRFKLDIL